jgi:hypothetical protein
VWSVLLKLSNLFSLLLPILKHVPLHLNLNNSGHHIQRPPLQYKPHPVVNNCKEKQTHHTTVQIIHHDDSWNSGLRNLFIFGTGGARMYRSVTRGGTQAQQLFILGSTIIAEGASRLITNSLNDPTYLRALILIIGAIWRGSDSAEVHLNSQAMPAPTAVNSSSSLPGSTVRVFFF